MPSMELTVWELGKWEEPSLAHRLSKRARDAKRATEEELGRRNWQIRRACQKILKLEEKFPCYNAVHKMGAEPGDKVVLVNPSEVVEAMKKVPKGKLITIREICMEIARKHRVKACCSLTTGIFTMTAANAAEEATKRRKKLEHSLLAHAESKRIPEREISWWR